MKPSKIDTNVQKIAASTTSAKKASILLLHKYYGEKAKRETALEAAKVQESKVALALRLRRAKRRLLLDTVDANGECSSSLSYSDSTHCLLGDDSSSSCSSARRLPVDHYLAGDEEVSHLKSPVPKGSLRLNGASISLED